MFNPRPKQAEVLQFQKGKMGVAAVPGSGKTQTLSYLAAQLIAKSSIEDDQEVLIVTLVNSAVNNFSLRVKKFVEEFGLLPGLGYRVRTLHGLAHDIVRERPDLVGLSEKFQIIDDREANRILDDSVNNWMRANPEFINSYSNPEVDLSRNSKVQKGWHDQIVQVATSFIGQAKDLQAMPGDIYRLMKDLDTPHPLLQMGYEIYASYQQGLHYRTAVDFNDLIRLALEAVETDPAYLKYLQHRWPYILEDEAQDSSSLQEKILRKLSGEQGNWVRVGDPNQAIFETFTTADPRFLLNFLKEKNVAARELPNSGRSTESIIGLANQLIYWTREQHPNPALKNALSEPYILPTPPGDPQKNPADQPLGITLYNKKLQPDKELELIARSLQQWLPKNPDQTAAVLVPRNERGAKLVDILKQHNVEYVELLRSSLSTRETASLLCSVLRCLADPGNPSRLAALYKQKTNPEKETEDVKLLQQNVEKLLLTCSHLEDYLWPKLDRDWIKELEQKEVPGPILNELHSFRSLIQRWQKASLLPIDQLVLSIAQDLFTMPADLALSQKLALMLEQTARSHPDWQFPEFVNELENIASNQQKFIGFSEEDIGFDPDQHKGKVVVATMHKAKGLEWDRVYLTSVNNYDYPSAEQYDQYIGEKWFIRDKLNLQAETLAQLTALLRHEDVPGEREEGQATRLDRIKYAEERLRLLYVGITRAKRELTLTYNIGRRGDCQPALAFVALNSFWEEKHAAS